MSFECHIEVRAATAAGIDALARLNESPVTPISETSTIEVHRYRLEPGIHETFGSLLMAIKWSDLAYGATGSLIAAGILHIVKFVLRASIPSSASVEGVDGTEATAVRIEMIDGESILRIEVVGIEAATAAALIREVVSRENS